jgi:hypothetical protein
VPNESEKRIMAGVDKAALIRAVNARDEATIIQSKYKTWRIEKQNKLQNGSTEIKSSPDWDGIKADLEKAK